MMENILRLKQLEQTGALRIIYSLHIEGPLLTSKLLDKLYISNDAYYKARNMLLDIGIIDRNLNKYGTHEPFFLTDKGKKLAETIVKLPELL